MDVWPSEVRIFISIHQNVVTDALRAHRTHCSGGPKAALMSAAFGGVILSMIEGLGIAVSRMSSDSYKPARPVEPPVMLPPSPPVAPPSNHSSSPSYENSFEQQGQTEQGAYSL